MAKSTNHTAHNQSYKNHRNGIKKPEALGKGQRRTQKGVRCWPLSPQLFPEFQPRTSRKRLPYGTL